MGIRWFTRSYWLGFLITGLALTSLARNSQAAPEIGQGIVTPDSKTRDRVSFEATVEPAKAAPGSVVKLKIQVKFGEKFYTYPVNVRTEPQSPGTLTEINYSKESYSEFAPLWPLEESEPKLSFIKDLNEHHYKHIKPYTITQDILIKENAKPGTHDLILTLKHQVCDDNCVIGEATIRVPIEVTSETAKPLSEELSKRLAVGKPDVKVVEPSDDEFNSLAETAKKGLIAFMLAGVFWGGVSLITPCVFPMIPITVSFFLKQSEKKNNRPLLTAIVYSLTIIIVLTTAAVALLSVFRELSTHWAMNFFLGGLFIFFALSLFGMYEIQLPASLSRFTSSREGEGMFGTIFMALTFTIISFACVAPFLGGFTGTADTQDLKLYHLILGGLAFSVTFAAPFFLLALFPTLLKKMPQSGGWLNSVKVVMGFLEVAAALKFFRTAEILGTREVSFLTYDFVLGLYIALSILCGLYLLGVYRLSHDSPVEAISAPRMLLGMLFVCIGLYLLPGMFKDGEGRRGRPGGVVFAWLDSFLLPEGGSDLPWQRTLEQGLASAQSGPKKKLVFIDFTGESCTNCKLNEKNVFSQVKIHRLLEQYSLVQLYTDKVPLELYEESEGLTVADQRAEAKRNLEYQNKIFKTTQLPLYVIAEPDKDGKYVTPDGKMRFNVIKTYTEGKINNPGEFASFLREPLSEESPTSEPGPTTAKEAPKEKQPEAPIELTWHRELEAALQRASNTTSKRTFIDFTGESCINCKINEIKVFPIEEVRQAMDAYSLAKLYTDVVPEKLYPKGSEPLSEEKRKEEALANLELERTVFNNEQQPLYAIVEPSPEGKHVVQGGKTRFNVIAIYDEGRISDPKKFVAFLKKNQSLANSTTMK